MGPWEASWLGRDRSTTEPHFLSPPKGTQPQGVGTQGASEQLIRFISSNTHLYSLEFVFTG